MRPFCGVDVSNVRTEEDLERSCLGRWGRWDRKMMGLKISPYYACQAVKWAKATALVNQRDPRYLFNCDMVSVNLPQSESYDCKCP